ncbi:type II toxin-antitoxin system antitoxin SocA domain-containing protein [Arthrobacter sp.]|uniref:Panacea domain-containing protein n=1 Tax=Arthrobacter sp. TaxID=1667 RepID=UPI00289F6108|nr:type II toxin-antitoxin system antitoxin SocA domain-containing protein [Arthrobacter sp.]
MPSVVDVAAYILDKKGEMSTMKLQKLCYFSQGWALAWTSEPLFNEEFQAWAKGPVSRPLFSQHKGEYSVALLPAGESSNLGQRDRTVVDAVLEVYSDMSGVQLSEISHRGFPWKSARGGLPEGARCETVISKESMKQHFKALL